MKEISLAENAARVQTMNELYELDERDKEGHPHRHTFTNLGKEISDYQEFASQMANFKKWNDKNYPLC